MKNNMPVKSDLYYNLNGEVKSRKLGRVVTDEEMKIYQELTGYSTPKQGVAIGIDGELYDATTVGGGGGGMPPIIFSATNPNKVGYFWVKTPSTLEEEVKDEI